MAQIRVQASRLSSAGRGATAKHASPLSCVSGATSGDLRAAGPGDEGHGVTSQIDPLKQLYLIEMF